MTRVLTAAALAAACLAGCGDDDSGDDTGGAADAAIPVADAAPPDAPLPDGPAPDADPSLPNLVLMGDRIEASLELDERDFFANSCAVVEGCAYPGTRRILRFATVTLNDSATDLVVGVPGDFGGASEWEWSDCHGHYHFSKYARYELVDASGEIVVAQDGMVIGRKQAFCLEDTDRINPGSKPASFNFCDNNPNDPQCLYNCNYQGISAGWADTYSKQLDCQWLDICGVPEGDYKLRIRINPEHLLAEGSYADNVFETPVSIPAAPAIPGLCQ